MVIINSIDEGFTLAGWIEVSSDFLEDRPIKILRDYLPVEAFNFKFHVIFQLGAIENFAGKRVINSKLIALLIADTLNTQFSEDIMRLIMVNQITVYDGFTVGVVKNRFSEDLSSMECRDCGQSNLHNLLI